MKSLSCVRHFATPWTAAYQAPPSMGVSRQEYWSGVPLPSPDLVAAAAAAKSLQSCPTLQPHRWQPPRLPRPWESPGKNTGMGCHFLLQCMKVKSESEVAKSRTPLSDFTFTLHFHALKDTATHSSVLAWRMPGTEEPGGLLSMGSQRVGHD